MYENLMWYIYSAMSVKLYYLWSPALTCACMFLIKLNNVFFFCKNGSFLVFHSGKINTWQIWELGFGLWWSHVAFASPYQTYIPLPFDSGIIYTWALCLVSNWCEKIRFFFFRCFAFWDLIIGNLGMWVWFLNVDIFYIFLYIFFQCYYDDWWCKESVVELLVVVDGRSRDWGHLCWRKTCKMN